MVEWVDFLGKLEAEVKEVCSSGCDMPFFRGHNDSTWKLIPSLYRVIESDYETPEQLEMALYVDFTLYSGPLYDQKLESWVTLFELRHAGLPTRLLDWTESLPAALFFALRGVDWAKNEKKKKKLIPCIWIMDSYELNKEYYGKPGIAIVDDFPFNYREMLDLLANNTADSTEVKTRLGLTRPLAILPPRSYRRTFAQKSVFTLHIGDIRPLEIIANNCLRKIEIPLDLIHDVQNFLSLMGINEYSLYPDADGLGRYLKDKHEIRQK